MRAVLHARADASAALSHALSSIDGLELCVCPEAADAIEAIDGADILLLPQSFYAGEMEEAAARSSTLGWIQILSAGYEKLAGRSFPAGVRLTSAGPAFSASVADHAVALLLSLSRRLPHALDNQRHACWDSGRTALMTSLSQKEALIVGYGSIGEAIGERLRAFGMRITGVSRSGKARPAADLVVASEALDSVLARADAVILALPHSRETTALFDGNRLASCKRGAIIVNVGRGSAVVLDDLVEALESGRIGGAGLDVTEPEPLPADHRLWRAPNTIVTPHIGGMGGHAQLAQFVEANMRAFLKGEALLSPIEPG